MNRVSADIAYEPVSQHELRDRSRKSGSRLTERDLYEQIRTERSGEQVVRDQHNILWLGVAMIAGAAVVGAVLGWLFTAWQYSHGLI